MNRTGRRGPRVAGWLGRLLAGLVLVLVGWSATAQPASAGDPDDPAGSGQVGVGASQACSMTSLDYSYLPVDRWNGATTKLHTRSSGGLFDPAPASREIQGSLFYGGSDFLFSLTSKVVTGATQFCPLQAVGGAVDRAAATFGKVMVSSPLLTGLMVIAVIGLLVQSMRARDRRWMSRLMVKILAVALFAVMVAGATQSTGGGIDGDTDTPYRPGTGSPGWFATTIDTAVTTLAAAPARAVSSGAIVQGRPGGDEIDCDPYLGALKRGYGKATKDGSIDSKAAPPEAVSDLWQISAYKAWSVSQFGGKNLNGQQRVACRMLDQNASIPVGIGSFVVEGQNAAARSTASVTDVMARVPAQQMTLTGAARYVKPEAPAWRPLNEVEADKAAVAWATCTPRGGKIANLAAADGWKAPPGNAWLIHDDGARKNAETVDGSPKLNRACYQFFNKPGDKVDDIFDWGDGTKELDKHKFEMSPSVYDFISTLHGDNQISAGSAAISYTLTAVGVAAVYGSIGVGIIVVKLIALTMLFGVMLALLLVLLPGADASRLVQFGRGYLGLSFFAAFAVFLMALITLFTKIVWQLLALLPGGGSNSVTGLIVGGLAPVMAAAALHFGFKWTGLPSPVTISGAASWGSAFGGGAALAAVATGAGRIGSKASDLAAGKVSEKNPFSQTRRNQALVASGKLGRTNAEILDRGGSPQKITPLRHGERHGTSANTSSKKSPEEILKSPTASAAQKRAAKREQLTAWSEHRDNQKEARQQERADRADERAETTRGERARQFGSDRVLDARRALSPENLKKLPKAAITLAAAGALGGLPGIGVAAAGMATKSVGERAAARQREHRAERRQVVNAYHQRARADQSLQPRRYSPRHEDQTRPPPRRSTAPQHRLDQKRARIEQDRKNRDTRRRQQQDKPPSPFADKKPPPVDDDKQPGSPFDDKKDRTQKNEKEDS